MGGSGASVECRRPRKVRCEASLPRGKLHFSNRGVVRVRGSGSRGYNGWRAGEEGKGRDGRRQHGRGHRLNRGGYRNGRSGSWCVNNLNTDMRGSAEAAVSVRGCTVGVGVRHLHNPGDDHQQNAHHRQEDSPRLCCIRFVAVIAHRFQLYRTARWPGSAHQRVTYRRSKRDNVLAGLLI
jgi:hypothetical protein